MQTSEINTQIRNEFIHGHLARSADVIRRTAEYCADAIEHAASLIIDCFGTDGKLLICGNGGSAAESQLMASELTNRLSATVERRALPALALTTDSSLLTACADDFGMEHVFQRQVQAFGRSQDVLLGISANGNASNVVAAMRQARKQGLCNIALVGSSGDMLPLADCAICIPDADIQSIHEAQLAVVHILCALIEQSLEIPYSDEREVMADQALRNQANNRVKPR